MKTLQETLLDRDYEANIGRGIFDIPLSVFADSLEGGGHPQLLRKHMKIHKCEDMFDEVWGALQNCEMGMGFVTRFTRYELDIIKDFAKQNPVDVEEVINVVKKKLYDPLYQEALEAGRWLEYERNQWIDKQVQTFFDPNYYNRRFYAGMKEFYFFVVEGQAGWISIRKKADQKDVEFLHLILTR